MQSSTQHTAADNKVGEALQQNNQKGNLGSTKSTGNSRGGPDPSIYSFALYVRWSAKAKTAYPISAAKLAALLKNDVFGQNEGYFITDDLLKGQKNGSKSGYTVISAKPTAEQHVGQACTVDDSAFLFIIHKSGQATVEALDQGYGAGG